jgi:hypothetical protein
MTQMAGDKVKAEVVTFKVDDALLDAMRGVPNRSEFIRAAVLAALDSTCPVCKGTGILTPNQKEHWSTFAADHSVEECDECHEFRLVCVRTARGDKPHARKRPSKTGQ